MKKTLSLTFPDVVAGQDFLIESEPKSVRSQVGAEDYGTIELEIQRITEIVSGLNRAPQSLSELEANLGILHDKYLSLSQLSRDYSLVNLSISNQQDRLMHELSLEMSYACKRYLIAIDANTKWVFNLPKKLANAVNICMFYLTILQNEIYDLKQPIPSYIWSELYQLYFYSESQKLLKVKVKHDTSLALTGCGTVMGSFIRVSFMAALSPSELSREESWNLFQYLQATSSSITVSKELTLVKTSRCLTFNSENKSSPLLIESLDSVNDKSQRVISLDGFILQVNNDLSTYASEGTLPSKAFLSTHHPELAERLLQLMYRYSVQYIRRESDRYPIDVEVQTVWGFESIMEHLQTTSEQEQPSIRQNDDTAHSISKLWQTVNESQGGLCIQKTGTTDSVVGNATPLLFNKQVKKRPNKRLWQLGLTCWSNSNKGYTQVGIKLVAGQLQIVHLSNLDGELLLLASQNRKNGFLLTKPDILINKKNIALQLEGKKVLAQCLKTFKCDDADLVQIAFTRNF